MKRAIHAHLPLLIPPGWRMRYACASQGIYTIQLKYEAGNTYTNRLVKE